jgi:hypothetical protein
MRIVWLSQHFVPVPGALLGINTAKSNFLATGQAWNRPIRSCNGSSAGFCSSPGAEMAVDLGLDEELGLPVMPQPPPDIATVCDDACPAHLDQAVLCHNAHLLRQCW